MFYTILRGYWENGMDTPSSLLFSSLLLNRYTIGVVGSWVVLINVARFVTYMYMYK